jgi:arsenical pump membrane protein
VRQKISPSNTLGVGGVVACAVAFVVNGHDAWSAVAQDWSPFVLVTGLLLVGLVADDDGLFKAAGERLAKSSSSGIVLFLGATILVGSVTAVLNLDTSVAFLTPVLVYAARSRDGGEAPLLYGCLLLSNAGSLFLPGSNLTNLIVLGHARLTGAAFISHMWAPGLVALLVTAGVIAIREHRELRVRSSPTTPSSPVTWGLGVVAIGACALFVVVLASPALEVLGVGVAAIAVRLARKRDDIGHVVEVLGVPILIGLFGVAVVLGTLGRAWSYPATAMAHLNVWTTGAVAALAAVVFNNLPAASLLSAHTPPHPYALLIGLNLGPNLFVSGSLAWLLWLRAARVAGAQPSIARASSLGLWSVPLSVAAALAALVLLG